MSLYMEDRYNIEDIRNKIIHGNVMDVLRKIPSNSIDMAITSPPYWSLRDYGIVPVIWGGDKDCEHTWYSNEKKFGRLLTPMERIEKENNINGKLSKHEQTIVSQSFYCEKCGAWRGQLGLEPDFNMYIDHLIEIFREIKRVIKPTGTLWVNIGDCYYTKSGSKFLTTNIGRKDRIVEKKLYVGNELRERGLLPKKCLCLLPFRFAIRMVDELGWILRNVIIWHKPDCLPDSTKDRFTVDFEYLFFFTKQHRYYFNQQFEPLSRAGLERAKYSDKIYSKALKGIEENNENLKTVQMAKNLDRKGGRRYVPLYGRNKRSVWRISSEPFPESHFAVFPTKLIETPIKAGCPEFVCVKCGRPLVKKYKVFHIDTSNNRGSKNMERKLGGLKAGHPSYDIRKIAVRKFIGYDKCDCNAGYKPGIVLDPFMGTGTTALVARKLGRDFIGIEISKKYINMAWRRLEREGWKNQKRLDDFGIRTL